MVHLMGSRRIPIHTLHVISKELGHDNFRWIISVPSFSNATHTHKWVFRLEIIYIYTTSKATAERISPRKRISKSKPAWFKDAPKVINAKCAPKTAPCMPTLKAVIYTADIHSVIAILEADPKDSSIHYSYRSLKEWKSLVSHCCLT